MPFLPRLNAGSRALRYSLVDSRAVEKLADASKTTSRTRSLRLRTLVKPHSRARTLAAIRAALEAAGVEFTNGDAPGVRLRTEGGGG